MSRFGPDIERRTGPMESRVLPPDIFLPESGRRHGLRGREIAGRANHIDGLKAVVRIRLPQDASYVIFHGGLREIHAGGDFLIGQALGDQADELELPVRQ